MKMCKRFGITMFVILFLGLVTCSQQTMAQATTDDVSPTTQRDKKNDDFDLETRLYFIVLSNREASELKLPVELDPVLKQLRSALAFKSQRLAVTLVNRVKNNRHFNLKWIGVPLPAAGASTPATPTFNELSIGQIDAVSDAGEPWIIRVSRFGFSSRIPVQTSVPGGVAGGMGVVNYEPIGLSSDFSMREGQPVLLGTLSVDASGDAIILAMSAKRTN